MSVKPNKRGRYEIEFMLYGERVHRICRENTTKAQAREWENRLRSEIFRVKKLGGLPEYSLQQAIQRYLDEYQGRDKSRTTGKAKTLGRFIEGYRLADVAVVAQEVASDTETSPSTRNRRLAILRRTANLAYRKWGWLEKPIGDKIQLLPENPSREVFLSKKEIDQLAKAQTNQQVKAAIYIAAYTGLRSGEILALQPENVNRGLIHVRTSKSGKARMVPVVSSIRPWLRYLPIGLHNSTLSHAVSDAMPGVRFHDLRHSCASLLIAAGVDLYTISKILGHSTIAVTQRYSHLETKSLKKAMNKLR